MPSVSIVVMGYHDRDTVVRAVSSVVGQRSPEPFEVLFVTSGGDDSAALVRKEYPDLTVVESPVRLLPGGARNAGLAAARGPIVVFLGADCVADPGWVANRLAAHRNGHAAVASAIVNGERWRPAAWAYHFELYCTRQPGRLRGPVDATDPAAHSLSLDRRAIERLGAFDESLRIGEDTEAAKLLAAAGISIWFEPSVRTRHFGPRNTVAMVRELYVAGVRGARHGGQPIEPRGGLVGHVLRALVISLRRRVVWSWRYGGPDRWWVLIAAPWILIARVSVLAGWLREVRRMRSVTTLEGLRN